MMTWRPTPIPDDEAFAAIKAGIDSLPPGVKMFLNSGKSALLTPSVASLNSQMILQPSSTDTACLQRTSNWSPAFLRSTQNTQTAPSSPSKVGWFPASWRQMEVERTCAGASIPSSKLCAERSGLIYSSLQDATRTTRLNTMPRCSMKWCRKGSLTSSACLKSVRRLYAGRTRCGASSTNMSASAYSKRRVRLCLSRQSRSK